MAIDVNVKGAFVVGSEAELEVELFLETRVRHHEGPHAESVASGMASGVRLAGCTMAVDGVVGGELEALVNDVDVIVDVSQPELIDVGFNMRIAGEHDPPRRDGG
jgi:hypothetical protein